jgi:hypothetical protein
MRRTFGTIALLTALAAASAAMAQQQDAQQLQQQQDRQQWNVERGLQGSADPFRGQYHAMADTARRHAEQAKTPESKARWIKSAAHWDQLALQADRRPQADR